MAGVSDESGIGSESELLHHSQDDGLLNRVPKYVASRTLADPLAWHGSTLLAESIAESVTSLKERHDELHVIGSLNLVQSLLVPASSTG